MQEYINIKGAREHNLKNISIKLPRDKFIVITGLSGSGKSSLAFDTIYAEGQRRYVESLSSYARQFLGQMDKPDVDLIEGLSPAISIDQKTTSKNPRSTVGTVTEIHDYLRLLYARAGEVFCPKCGKKINRQTVDQMLEEVKKLPVGTKIMILAPVVRAKKGEHKKLLEGLQKDGFTRARVDGQIYVLEDEEISLIKNKKHTIEAVVDRLKLKEGQEKRITDSLETTLKLSGGLVTIYNLDADTEQLLSENFACADCGISIDEISPRLFSFNSPFGACPACTGLGVIMKVDPDSIIYDENLSLNEGAIRVSGWNLSMFNSFSAQYIGALAKHYGFSMDVPYKDLPETAKQVILYGTGEEAIEIEYHSHSGVSRYKKPFEGIVNSLERRFVETQSEGMKRDIAEYMMEMPCHECGGRRYKKEALAVKIGGLDISQLSDLSIVKIKEFLNGLTLGKKEQMVASRVLKELNARLDFLINVGLEYLTLSRQAATLSGGEAQRIRLATQIGSKLMGVLYILDEPSIGLHQRDNTKLLSTLKELRDLGNTLLVVEHDEETMLEADYLLDIGPGAGENGGEVIAFGTPQEVMAVENSITGQYLSRKKTIRPPKQTRVPKPETIQIIGAAQNNLKEIDVEFPLGVITAVTGVSGSGKSSLVNEILFKAAARKLNGSRLRPGKHKKVLGLENIDKVIDIDQSPIGRTPRSNPATYTGVFDPIREVFAMTQDAKVRGYSKGRFSFNVKGGRCEVCKGDGILKIEMHFLPDVYVPCEVCKGQRYTSQTLEVRYKGKNIYEVLEMTVDEAYEFFKNIPKIEPKLKLLKDVGLGYIKLGQSSTTLSGGEAQRIKLATHLSKRQTGRTLYILDEPTTGLHIHDVKKLIGILNRLADGGNTVIVIEHNLDVIKCADYVIDIGPEGGDRGGQIIATGTPRQVAQNEKSYTGQYLKRVFEKDDQIPENLGK